MKNVLRPLVGAVALLGLTFGSMAQASAYYPGQNQFTTTTHCAAPYEGYVQGHWEIDTTTPAGSIVSGRANGYAVYNSNAYIRKVIVREVQDSSIQGPGRTITFTGSSQGSYNYSIPTSYLPVMRFDGTEEILVNSYWSDGKSCTDSFPMQ